MCVCVCVCKEIFLIFFKFFNFFFWKAILNCLSFNKVLNRPPSSACKPGGEQSFYFPLLFSMISWPWWSIYYWPFLFFYLEWPKRAAIYVLVNILDWHRTTSTFLWAYILWIFTYLCSISRKLTLCSMIQYCVSIYR